MLRGKHKNQNSFHCLCYWCGWFCWHIHVSLALKRRGDGILGLDNFNHYYDPDLKRARRMLLDRAEFFIVKGDIYALVLIHKVFDAVMFTHVMHLAAQVGVRFAMQNPNSYVLLH
ncbi:hypothetical protein K1719_030936 [Acacia pycnantha]|nr:hypothetical protein K1719_030936 [Acacia pycnantha]